MDVYTEIMPNAHFRETTKLHWSVQPGKKNFLEVVARQYCVLIDIDLQYLSKWLTLLAQEAQICICTRTHNTSPRRAYMHEGVAIVY